MSKTVTLDEASTKLREIIGSMHSGDEIRIVDDHREVARLVVSQERSEPPRRRQPGLGKGSLVYMAPDFDDPIDDLVSDE
ncbi:type II toxin-antitoxin system prevent-host-death family antitoxin [bacterium]|nr:type II toxin-antitoxin system prevent-host-death family antitoxin [bacterium]